MIHPEKTIFLLILLAGVWQDFRSHHVDRRYLQIGSLLGLLCCVVTQREWMDVAAACGIGIVVLVISKLTSGEIGEGDGWFFIISGMYLNWLENLNLLMSGLIWSFLWSVIIILKGVFGNGQWKKQRMAFLPFLLPGAVWLVLGA